MFEESKKDMLNRVSYVIGHIHGIQGMVQEGRDCSEVLIQISAVQSALGRLKAMVLKEYVTENLAIAIREKDVSTLGKLDVTIDKLLE